MGHREWGDYAQAKVYLLKGIALAREYHLEKEFCTLLLGPGQVEISTGEFQQSESLYHRKGWRWRNTLGIANWRPR